MAVPIAAVLIGAAAAIVIGGGIYLLYQDYQEKQKRMVYSTGKKCDSESDSTQTKRVTCHLEDYESVRLRAVPSKPGTSPSRNSTSSSKSTRSSPVSVQSRHRSSPEPFKSSNSDISSISDSESERIYPCVKYLPGSLESSVSGSTSEASSLSSDLSRSEELLWEASSNLELSSHEERAVKSNTSSPPSKCMCDCGKQADFKFQPCGHNAFNHEHAKHYLDMLESLGRYPKCPICRNLIQNSI